MNLSPTIYIEALLNNDRQVLENLYLEAIPSITAYIVKNSGYESDARDIFQDAMLAVLQKAQMGQLQINSGFQPYFFAVCRNLWLMRLRKNAQKRVTSMGDEQHILLNDSFKEAEQTANHYARLRLLETKLKELGESCRKLLRLAWSGKPLEEVAKILNNSYAYIRKKKSECIGRLVELVKNDPIYAELKE